MTDKPLTENCGICSKKIHLNRGFGWADVGPETHPEYSVHVECLPQLEMIVEKFQNDLNRSISEAKYKS
jgi:hypothetical protein